MIQVQVEKNKILQEDIDFGIGAVTQTRGGQPFNGNKVNSFDLPFDESNTLGDKINEIQTQYDYIIANVEDDPSAVPMTNLIRKSGDNLVDNLSNVFTPQVVETSDDDEASYTKKLWVKIISSTEHHLKRGADIIAKFNPVTHAQLFDYSAIATVVAGLFGTAAVEDVGTSPGNVVQLDGTGKLPAIDGSQLTGIAASGLPIGSVIMWAGSSVPSGYLACNGSAVSRTTYADLFTAIGTTYGLGDGSTTFQLPDTRGEFIRGLDSGRGVDTGRTLGSAQEESLSSHSHGAGTLATGSAGDHSHSVSRYTAGTNNVSGYGVTTTAPSTTPSTTPNAIVSTSGAHTHSLTGTTDETGGSEVRPRNIAFMFIIKAL